MVAGVSASEQHALMQPLPSLKLVIVASSTGSLIEWYDFYLYASMGAYLGRLFFPQAAHHGMLGLLFSMATLGLGFAIRPLGGLVFGSLGDRLGRKYSFLLTMLLMGFATTCMGLLPAYRTAGYAAPIALLSLRIMQGLAAGGEVGGAVSYVAESSPDRQRGWYLGILTTMAPLGTLLSLAAVYLSRAATGVEGFAIWGWRIPFLVSGILVAFSLYFRLRLRETAVFEALRHRHQAATSPARELFTVRENILRLLLAVFGSTAGQSALGLTALGFAPSFMQAVLKIDIKTSSLIAIVAVFLALPVYVLSGRVSDSIGRRPMIILGTCLAVVFYGPIYYGMQLASAPVRFWPLVFYNWVQIVFVAIVLPATIASLAELFPTRLRSTGIGVTYNISNGLLNGFSPLIGFALIAATGSIYSGLAYPIALASVTAIVSFLFVKETYRSVLK